MKDRTINRRTIIAATFVILLLTTLQVTGVVAIDSYTRIGFIGHESAGEWSAGYLLLQGSLHREVDLGEEPRKINVKVNTQSGSIHLKIVGSSGEVLYSRENIASSVFDVSATGKVAIYIDAQMHRGDFKLSW